MPKEGMDWSDWEKQCNGRQGQPPIPLYVMAGVILYGLMRRIRSSRQLEYACGHNIDFIWLAEGRKIDHSTICIFRKNETAGCLGRLSRRSRWLSLRAAPVSEGRACQTLRKRHPSIEA